MDLLSLLNHSTSDKTLVSSHEALSLKSMLTDVDHWVTGLLRRDPRSNPHSQHPPRRSHPRPSQSPALRHDQPVRPNREPPADAISESVRRRRSLLVATADVLHPRYSRALPTGSAALPPACLLRTRRRGQKISASGPSLRNIEHPRGGDEPLAALHPGLRKPDGRSADTDTAHAGPDGFLAQHWECVGAAKHYRVFLDSVRPEG